MRERVGSDDADGDLRWTPAGGVASPPSRFQKLCPHPNGPSREQVVAHQRERLWRAMVQIVVSEGYDATTVARLCVLAGVSKRAFYELFTGKPACFALAYERVVSRAAERVMAAGDGRRPGRERLAAAVGALLDEVARRPRAARFALVCALDATPDALERRAWALELLERGLTGDSAGEDLAPAVRRGIAAGVIAVARARLLEGRTGELPGLAGELADWGVAPRAGRGRGGAACRGVRARRRAPGAKRLTGDGVRTRPAAWAWPSAGRCAAR